MYWIYFILNSQSDVIELVKFVFQCRWLYCVIPIVWRKMLGNYDEKHVVKRRHEHYFYEVQI